MLAAALFLFFYVGAEVAFGGWVSTYAVALQLASAVGAAYLTAGFWCAFTVGRLLAIPLAMRVPSHRMVLVALALCLALLAVLLLLPDTRVVVWSVVFGLGFCMAPLWPMGFTLAGQSLTLTATVSGLILLGDSVGGMVLPWLVGHVMAVTGPRALASLVFGSLVCTFVAFVVLLAPTPSTATHADKRRRSGKAMSPVTDSSSDRGTCGVAWLCSWRMFTYVDEPLSP